MAKTDDLRVEHAKSVPVYVRDDGDSWSLVESSSGDVVSGHGTAKGACWAALEREDVGGDAERRDEGKSAGFVKRANLRDEGDPIGEWRWLDASAEEDEPVGGSRLTAASMWELAASLNDRKSAVPINGGGAPSGEYAASVPHGDAWLGGDHPANGYAHVGVPVIDEDGRTHLFLFAELLHAIAREVDLGRLAYGSIRFGYDEIDEDDNDAIKGATLISHALTNDPAVTTLTAGSERRRETAPSFVACRTRRTTTMAKKETKSGQRGPAMDVLGKIAGMLNVELADEMEGDGWYSPIVDAINALKTTAKVEDIVEGGSATEPPADAGGDDTASARAAVRDVDGMTPEEVDEHFADMLAWGREVLGKPDASAADVLAELEARKEEVGAALGADVAPAAAEETAEADDDPDESDETKAKVEPDEKKPEDKPKPEDDDEKDDEFKGRSARELRTDVRALRSKLRVFEMREWLDEELTKRKLVLPKSEREELVADGLNHGREMALKLIAAKHRPPSTHPLDHTAVPTAGPMSLADAVKACWQEAETEVRATNANAPRHYVYAQAERIARKRWPELNNSGAKQGATSAA